MPRTMITEPAPVVGPASTRRTATGGASARGRQPTGSASAGRRARVNRARVCWPRVGRGARLDQADRARDASAVVRAVPVRVLRVGEVLLVVALGEVEVRRRDD